MYINNTLTGQFVKGYSKIYLRIRNCYRTFSQLTEGCKLVRTQPKASNTYQVRFPERILLVGLLMREPFELFPDVGYQKKMLHHKVEHFLLFVFGD